MKWYLEISTLDEDHFEVGLDEWEKRNIKSEITSPQVTFIELTISGNEVLINKAAIVSAEFREVGS